jgi:hypothetical protein
MNIKLIIKTVENNFLYKVLFYLIPFSFFVFILSFSLMKIELSYILEKYPNPYLRTLLIFIGRIFSIEAPLHNDTERLALGLLVSNFVLILLIINNLISGVKRKQF